MMSFLVEVALNLLMMGTMWGFVKVDFANCLVFFWIGLWLILCCRYGFLVGLGGLFLFLRDFLGC